MRILIVVPSLPPAGGAEQVAWELAKGFARHNETHVLTFSKEEHTVKKDGVEIHFLKSGRSTFKYYLTIGRKKVLKIVDSIQPGIINAHMNSVLSYILSNSKYKTVLSLHNSELFHYHTNLLKKIKHNIFFKRSVKKFNIVTTTSTHMQKYFNHHYQRNFRILPNGVDTETFKRIDSIERNEKMILHIGRLIKTKRVEIIFELAKKLPDYDFVIIGSGELKNKVSLPNLEFKGKVSDVELVNCYNKSSYSVFPSMIENFPLVGLEAMACGSIVIASSKGFGEYINNTIDGFMINHPSPDNIIEIINNYCNEERIRKKAIAKTNSYSWDKICSAYLKLYDSI